MSAALAGLLAFAPASANASASTCDNLPASLSRDSLALQGFQVIETQNLYRFQERPWVKVPTGARITVRAPAGVTEADLHRALTCTAGSESPLSVQGAKLRVERAGGVYQVHVTASERGAAREIQKLASAL